MTAELDTDPHSHDKVDQGHRVKCNVPPVHQAAEVDHDEDDDEEIDDTGHEVKSHEHECDNENRGQRNGERLESVLPHGQVLFIEDVEDGVREDVDMVLRIGAVVNKGHDAVSKLPGPSKRHVVILAGLQDGVEGHHVAGADLHQPAVSLLQLDGLSVGGVSCGGADVSGICLEEPSDGATELVRAGPVVSTERGVTGEAGSCERVKRVTPTRVARV